jgi:hypothetical protein
MATFSAGTLEGIPITAAGGGDHPHNISLVHYRRAAIPVGGLTLPSASWKTK